MKKTRRSKIETDPGKIVVDFRTIGKYFYVPAMMRWGSETIRVELCDIDTKEDDNTGEDIVSNLIFNVDGKDCRYFGIDSPMELDISDTNEKKVTLADVGIISFIKGR